MEQYISKDALVREIERQRNAYISEPGKYRVLSRILSFIDTLEVKEKEVDLEKEVSDWWNVHYAKISDHYHEFDKYSGHYMLNSTIIDFARYFFELGLKAQKGE